MRSTTPNAQANALRQSARPAHTHRPPAFASFAKPTRPSCQQAGRPVAASFRANAVAQEALPEMVDFTKPSSSFVADTEKYAIIDVGGVQHLVEEGRWYTCNRLKASPGDTICFGRVLAVKSNDEFHVGQPYVTGGKVEAEVVEDLKGPKIIVYKMRPKKHYRRTNGHRQPLSKFFVTKIDIEA